ncbi:MAG: hypothetical protein KAW52_03835 [candidate division Zixibacteria bacterium]|nr:hypothetical protein [candidate division Zixibacteria bacterium]
MRKKLTIFSLSIALILGMILISMADIPFILPIDLFLNTILDVNAGSPTDKDALIWDSTTAKWIPEARSTMPNSIDLDDLGDTNAGAPGDNNSLTWDAGTSKWIPEAIEAGISAEDLAFLDNFDDASRHWGWADDAKNGTIAEAGEIITLSVADSVNGGIGGGQNNGPRCLLGDPGAPFELKVKLNSYTVNNSTQAGICIANRHDSGSDSHWLTFGRTRKDEDAGLDGIAVTNFAGGWSCSNAITTLPIYLRFRITVLSKIGFATCECAYSTDDITYNVMCTVNLSGFADGFKENMVVGIFARNRVGGEVGVWTPLIEAPFEWFKMCRTLGPG